MFCIPNRVSKRDVQLCLERRARTPILELPNEVLLSIFNKATYNCDFPHLELSNMILLNFITVLEAGGLGCSLSMDLHSLSLSIPM
jgi:hypothetical protein